MERRFKPLKKISSEEASKYVSVDEDFTNSFICFYTVEPSTDSIYSSEDGWDTIMYYTNILKVD